MIMTSSKKTRSHHSLHTTQEHHYVTNPKKLKKCTIISGIPQKFHRFALFDPAKISDLMTPAHPILCAPWKKFWATDEASAYLDNDRLTPPNFHSGWCVPCGLWLVFLFHKIEKYIYIRIIMLKTIRHPWHQHSWTLVLCISQFSIRSLGPHSRWILYAM